MRSDAMSHLFAAAIWAMLCCGSPAHALEQLDRGVVAMATTDGKVYVGWRLLASDPADIGFDVFRSAAPGGEPQKLNASPVRDSCNFVDIGANGKSWCYFVRPVGDAATTEELQPVQSGPSDAVEGCKMISLQGDYGANKVGVADLDGDGKAEVALKTAPQAATPREALISPNGFVLEGPEYCSVLDGTTGRETARVDWTPRGNLRDRGDNTGNRVNRSQIGVAYLDGQRPSLLVLRGTYTMMKVDAYNYVDQKLEKVWSWFGDKEDPPIRGQGAHSLHALDVDNDGRDEGYIDIDSFTYRVARQ